MFQNPEIALDELPDMEDLEWQPLESGFARRMLLERVGITVIALAASVVPHVVTGGAFSPPVPLWVLVLVVAVPFLAWPFIALPRRGYVVRDKDIVFKSGVLWRSVTAVPFNRVQHVETSSTPLDRRFRLANLKIFTAGGSSGDLRIAGLAATTAERVRVYILDKVGASIENH